jgi:hypothetical protein
MKLWKVAATVALGIFASGSGVLKVQAATFAYQVDFLDKEVADFDDFKQSFNVNTYNLSAKMEVTFFGTYYFDTCSPNTTVDIQWRSQMTSNSGATTGPIIEALPDLICSTSPLTYNAFVNYDIPPALIDALMDDDLDFIDISSQIVYRTGNFLGRTLYLENWTNFFNIKYDFDTTYLFNYFLSDTEFRAEAFQRPAFWTINSSRFTFLEYVYTTAGNDTYLVENSLQVNIGTARKKYAINVDDIYFRGQSVGAQFRTQRSLGVDSITPTSSVFEFYTLSYRYHYLNTSNYQQPLANVPQFQFEEEDCGSFLALNVGCFINNGLAYIVNDAPIISDVFTLLNTGMQLGGQAFNTLGNFTDNNLIGVLVLGGAGLTAVRWFLKQDQ